MALTRWTIVAGCMLAWGVPLAQAKTLDAEWKDCVQEENRDLAISGCGKILARGNAVSAADRAIAYGNRGIAYAAKEDYESAIADYDAAIRSDPKYADAFFNRGVAHDAKDDHDLAIADYSSAIRLNPKYKDAYFNRGAAYEAKGEHDSAIADYSSAIRLDPKDADTYRNRGLAYEAKDDHDRAIADYDAAIRINPKYAFVYNDRGLAYEAKQDHERAIADYDSAILIDPEYVLAYANRAVAYRAKGDEDHAIADYDRAIALDSENAGNFNARGLVHEGKGDHDRAIADFGQAIRIDPEDSSTFSNRGVSRQAKGEHDLAIADYDQAIRLDPKDSHAYLLRGIAYLSKASHDHAIADFESAIRLDSSDAYPALLADIALARAGQPGRLRANSAGVDMDKWPAPLVKAWLDEMTPQEALDAATDTDAKTQRDMLCDAHFYLGEREMARNNKAAGLQHLRRAAADCPSTVVEYDVARAELAAIAAASETVPVKPATVAVPVAPAPVVAAVATPPVPAACATLGKRVALVVGNSAYPQAAALANPVNDAADVAAILREKLCFNVIEAKDATLAVFQKKIGNFAEAAIGADVALFYYAGHGMQFQQTNYLVPVDATMENEYDAIHGNISAQDVVSLLEPRAKVTLVFLDACRTNPIEDEFRRKMSQLGRGSGESRGLAPMASHSAETLVVFATRPNQQAADGSGRNSPFTQAFLDNIILPGQDIEKVMRDVTASVRTKTNGRQVPERLSGLEHDLVLAPQR